jgi:hypothetical protein
LLLLSSSAERKLQLDSLILSTSYSDSHPVNPIGMLAYIPVVVTMAEIDLLAIALSTAEV